ncbi:alpha/beta hydrolase [Streptomyces sp. NPDC006335]|uniref:alpha/beta fold hydrolase n=1 Tax=Streptomyces sp. NPDC006335 TaxID=3156895 RepID=UPI0033BF8352
MVEHRMVDVNGIRLHIAEEGEGPLVVLLHGFPESWHSWRHQFGPLAAAGFRVVAPDQRGYGASDHPEDVSAYSILHLVGDVVGLVHALGEETAFVIGHDWGAPVAWHTALLRPDVVRGVAGLSVPPPFRGERPPLQAMQERFGGRFYWNYFNRPRVADAEFGADPRSALRRLLVGASGDGEGAGRYEQALVTDPDRGWLADMPDPETLPAWLTEADLDELADSYAKGFTGALNWYRNLDRNWELTAPWHGARVTPPALYVYGDRDLVPAFPGTPELIERLPELMPNLVRDPVLLPGCGHWTQQERPHEVNALLVEFLTGLRD